MKTKSSLWPIGLVITFVLFFCSMAVVVVIAATHRDSLVSDDYYEQELQFQGRICAADHARCAGATISYDAAANQVVITLPAGQAAQHPSGTIQFYRPSAFELDRQFVLTPQADGTQKLDVSGLAAGNWSVNVAWKAGGEDYYLAKKFALTGK